LAFATPKKRDWRKGQTQAVFVRTPEGGQIQMTQDDATPDERAFAFCLLEGLRSLPDDVVKAVRVEYERLFHIAEDKRGQRQKASRPRA
jgi:hypothetical protein